MGRRQRKRHRGAGGAAGEALATTDYADEEGNVLTLRNALSVGTAGQLRSLDATPASSADDRLARRDEFLFERLAVRWEIAGLPLESQKELLGRFRMADSGTRAWVRRTIDAHLREHQPELAG